MLQMPDEGFFAYEHMGEFSTDAPWIHQERSIDSYEIIFVTEGVIHIEEDGVPYALFPNQLLLLEPHKIHRGYQESTGKTAFYWLHYQSNLPPPLKIYRGEEYYEIKYMLKKLLHIANTLSYSPSARDAAALMVYEELKKAGKEESSLHPMLGKITEYIRIHIRQNPTVASVAWAFGYHPDSISRIFRSSTGMSMKEYINRLKMNLARDYLLTTAFPLKQIAAELGFADEKLFIKFFLYHEKLSPTAFRHRFFNTHMNNH